MPPLSEIILTTIPGAREDEQLEVALLQIPGQGSRLELRYQTWGEGIGWFTQSRVPLEPHQVAELRGVFGSGMAQNNHLRSGNGPLPREFAQVASGSFVPRVVRADSA